MAKLEITVRDQDGATSTYACNGLVMALCQIGTHAIESQFVIQEISGINAVVIANKLVHAAVIQAQDELYKKLDKDIADKLIDHALDAFTVAIVREGGSK